MASCMERGGARPKVVLWLVACGTALHLFFVARAVFAECPDPLCPDYGPWPNCEEIVWACGQTVVLSTFPCCCTNGTTGCCQYWCDLMGCNKNPEDCPQTVRRHGGIRAAGPCANGHCQGGPLPSPGSGDPMP